MSYRISYVLVKWWKPLISAAAEMSGFVLVGVFPKPLEHRMYSVFARFFAIDETIGLSMAHFYTRSAPVNSVRVLLPAFVTGSFCVIAFPDKDPPRAAWQLSCFFWGYFLAPVTLLTAFFEGSSMFAFRMQFRQNSLLHCNTFSSQKRYTSTA